MLSVHAVVSSAEKLTRARRFYPLFCFLLPDSLGQGVAKLNANNSSSRWICFLDRITGQVTTEDVQQRAETTT